MAFSLKYELFLDIVKLIEGQVNFTILKLCPRRAVSEVELKGLGIYHFELNVTDVNLDVRLRNKHTVAVHR